MIVNVLIDWVGIGVIKCEYIFKLNWGYVHKPSITTNGNIIHNKKDELIRKWI